MFSPYAAMGNSPGMMIDPNGETTKYAEDLTAAENDWLMNSPERKAWNLGRNTGLNGAFRLLGHHPGSDMFMQAGGGGSKKGGKLGDLSDEIGRILEGAKGDWSSISLQFDDLGLTGGYWLNGNYKDLYYADGILPPITLVRSLGGWHVTDLSEARAAIQISLMSGGNNSLGLLGSNQQSNGGADDNGGFSPWGPTLIGLGQDVIPKDSWIVKQLYGKAFKQGAHHNTSVASLLLRKALPQRIDKIKYVPKPVANQLFKFAGTKTLGGVLGRFVPGAGWALFGYDIYDNRETIGEWIDEQQRINEANKNTPHWNICFEKGTLIYGSNGLIPIENINVGDSVYSYNLQTNTTELSKVANTFRRETGAIYELTFNHKIVYVTAEHPFYVLGKGWVKVKDLKAGDELQSSVKEKSVKITSVILQERNVMVYNIEVDKNHNYFVSDDRILVHNKSIEEFEEEPAFEEENENIID